MQDPTLVAESRSTYATFACKTHQDECEAFQVAGIEANEPLGDVCEAGFVSGLPPLWEDLPPCPGCGGLSILLELLIPMTG